MNRLLQLATASVFLTAAYVFAWPSANVAYFAAELFHVGAGIILLFALAFAVRRLLRTASRLLQIGWLLLGAGGLIGAALIFEGTRRSEWPLVWAHIAFCSAGGVLLLSDWLGKQGSGGSASRTPAARSAVLLFVAGAVVAGAWWVRTIPWERSNRIENPLIAPESMSVEGDGSNGPFFPSSAQTVHGEQIPANYFIESDSCERCHQDIYREWKSSAHHFSSFNNAWYRKSIEYMQDTVGIKPSKWCAGCHDPALLFSGMFNRPIREVEDTPAGQAGLGCMMCHSITRVKSTMGQGDFQLEYPVLHRLAASKNPYVRRLHDFLTELNPEPHRRVFLKPFMRTQTAEFCAACHKVHLDVPVNHYRWVRGFNEYDNWQASGVSGEGARSFYYPAKSQTCADCHMPLTKSADAGNDRGSIHSHQFVAANSALPYVNGNESQLKATESFLSNGELSVDIFAISPENAPLKTGKGSLLSGPGLATTFGVGEESDIPSPANAPAESVEPAAPISAPINRIDAAVHPGGTYRIDVVVRTRKVGHFFPGGTVDAYDCWLELSATDDAGHIIFWSGNVQDGGKGPVDPGAHFYRSLQIDAHGNAINKRNAWATRAVVYVHLIPPGAADTAHYRIQVPSTAVGHIALHAKLNYRKFAWWNTQFSFAGQHDANQRDPNISADYDDTYWAFTGDPSRLPGGAKGVPDLPIVVVAEDQVSLNVLPKNVKESTPTVELRGDDWTRWNDYGIGLLAQGDLSGAAAAFEKITECEPQNPDGWVNVGRVYLQEGNNAAAQKMLERALSLSPHLARAHFFYARALRNEGHYDDAIAHLREVLAQYPYDRVAHDEAGHILFLERSYSEAVREFQATLSIDPEDLEANYNLMLCYTGLHRADRAHKFEVRYLRFKADEASETLTGPYRLSHPEDNLERQPIHEHVSSLSERPRTQKSAFAATPARDSD